MDVVVGGFGQVVIPSVGENLKPGFEVAHSNRVVLVNEDCIPVATFLATREEDMVQLRRILEGKKPFPEPSSISGITIGSPQAPINLEIRKADSNPESATDSVAETPAEEDANAVEASEQKESDETPEGQTSLLRSSRRDWDVPRDAILTAVWLQDPAQDAVLSSDSNPDTSATNEHSFNQTDPEPTDDGGPPTKSVESNNDRITRLMPAWAAALPDINAGLNLASTVLLLSGFVSIKRKNQTLHRNLMISAFVLSVAFLGFYLTYHYALGKYTETYGRQFVGSEMARVVYRSILIPHVILAVFVPILAIRVFQHAFAGRWDKHRKLATITFPIWLFVSVTGVVIYWMLYRWN
ncbi:MAG: DUF420 domain-containing protein [Planctomycetaceae bacterium]